MRQTMQRGKQQILYNYLPGNTFDFQGGIISIISEIRGHQRNDLNKKIVLQRISEDLQGWPDERTYRGTLRNEVLEDPQRFVLVEPKEVKADLFPKVFWCTNSNCGRVYDYSNSNHIPHKKCKHCSHKLEQLRFIKTHRCGHIEPLTPPYCQNCNNSNHYSLDTRDSERIGQFRWICNNCGNTRKVFGGHCQNCDWEGETELKRMDIQPHRARKTYYSHSAVLLNLPSQEIDTFLNKKNWQYVVASKFLDLQETRNVSLSDYFNGGETSSRSSNIDDEGLDDLLDKFDGNEITKEDFKKKFKSLNNNKNASETNNLADELKKKSGVGLNVWRDVGKDLIEVILPVERSDHIRLSNTQNILKRDKAQRISHSLGFEDVILLNDFPIVNATYGYTRNEFGPKRGPHDDNIRTRINSFPSQSEYSGKIPIFVDDIQADAVMVKLDHNVVLDWLEINGVDINAILPDGQDSQVAKKSFFVELFYNSSLYETIDQENKALRLVFGLLHTLSHLSLKKAALLCGMQKTSLSEYIVPSTLSFALYCNHRFGATIGALTSLFEQSLSEWLESVKDSRSCVYDPVCREHEGSCHACTHLAETSCRFFNLNLSRAFLYGGQEIELEEIEHGFFDFIKTDENN